MDKILQNVARSLAPYKNKKLAVGVSGGRDSVCLLHAVINCGAVNKSDVLAVHVNHNLRKTADRDQNFVREFCEKNDIEFRAFSVNVNKTARDDRLTVEQAARNLRYAVFYDLIKSGAAEFVLTAHHALDNAETVLMHLFRGSGLDGMRGMSGGDRTFNSLPVVRPFLDIMPSELDEYVKNNGLDYVVDETNFDDDADRNYVRLNVIPLIEQRYKGAVGAINAFAAECADACDVLDGMLDRSLITFNDGAAVIADKALSGGLATRYVRAALERFTAVDVTREQTVRTAELVNARTGAVVELTGGIIAVREYGGIALYVPRAFNDVQVPVCMGANYIDGLAVDIFASAADPKSVRGGAVDGNKLDGAVLRFRRDGDVFTPCGGKKKKLKQYFIDNKIPKRKRDRTPLICKGSEVLVIVGMQVSELVKQTGATTAKTVIELRR